MQLPDNEPLPHVVNGDNCWCNPTTKPVKRDDGSFGWVIVHRDIAQELIDSLKEDQ